MIPYGKQSISEDDIAAVNSVLRSDWLTQGPLIEKFEQSFAGYVGAAHGVAVSNATAALHLACQVLSLGKGDYLWTVPNTFVASANCGLYCGATVDFVDIDPATYNISISALAAKLEVAERENRLPKIVIPVHFAGQSCDMREINRLAGRYGFNIIEDASHAVGAEYQGEKVGNCQYSLMSVFSFHPVKIMTTGEGGIITTNNLDLHQQLSRLRSHGITRNPEQMTGPSDGPWYYELIELGFNYRITDLQAALGVSQLSRLELFLSQRRRLAGRYNSLLAGLPIILPFQESGGLSSYHLYPIQIASSAIKSRLEVFNGLRSRGIGVNVHYIPVHLQPVYARLGFSPGQFPNAESYYAHAISLPLYYELTDREQDQVVAALRDCLS